jgi:hypothetical protein
MVWDQRYEKPALVGSYAEKAESPPKGKIKDMYNNTPKSYGLSLHEKVRQKLIFDEASRGRLKNPYTRETEIHNIVYKWRKEQIDHTEYTKNPDLRRESIIKHSYSWFKDLVLQDMKDFSIISRGWFGDTEGHREAAKKGWANRKA